MHADEHDKGSSRVMQGSSRGSEPGLSTRSHHTIGALGHQRHGQGCCPLLLLPHSPTGSHMLTYVHTPQTLSQLCSHSPINTQPSTPHPRETLRTSLLICAHGGLCSRLLDAFPDRRWLFGGWTELFGTVLAAPQRSLHAWAEEGGPPCTWEIPAGMGAQTPGVGGTDTRPGVGFFQCLNGTHRARLAGYACKPWGGLVPAVTLPLFFSPCPSHNPSTVWGRRKKQCAIRKIPFILIPRIMKSSHTGHPGG